MNKSFGPAHIIRDVSLRIARASGTRHAVIGPNGAGKSTLFHFCSGQFAPTSGRILLEDEVVSGLSPAEVSRREMARSFQITNIFPCLTVYENLRVAVMRRHGLQFVFWRPVSRLKQVAQEVDALLEQVRLTSRAHSAASQLSYSEQLSLEIGMTLASNPRVIMLDEPMAGMSHEETACAVGLIREISRNRSLRIVAHDMEVVFTLTRTCRWGCSTARQGRRNGRSNRCSTTSRGSRNAATPAPAACRAVFAARQSARAADRRAGRGAGPQDRRRRSRDDRRHQPQGGRGGASRVEADDRAQGP